MSEQRRPRVSPPRIGDEREVLLAFLDFHRSTLLRKTDGLGAAQLATVVAPSAMSLGGLLRHLATVEHAWFNSVFLGGAAREPWASGGAGSDPDWVWQHAADDPDALRALLEREIAAARQVVAEHDLDELAAKPDYRGEPCSLRWIVAHMVQEYARHNGHADLLREAVDGATGV